MNDDMLDRSKKIQPFLSGFLKPIDGSITPDGKIIVRIARSCAIFTWSLILVLFIAVFWALFRLFHIHNNLHFDNIYTYILIIIIVYSLASAGRIIRNLMHQPSHIVLDNNLHQIMIYDRFPIPKLRQVVQIDSIQTLISYEHDRKAGYPGTGLYAYIDSNNLLPLMIGFGMDRIAGLLGYVCDIHAVHITDHEQRSSKLMGYSKPLYESLTSDDVDIKKMLDITINLYDPEIGDMPNWMI